jgi:subtilase family serine protease
VKKNLLQLSVLTLTLATVFSAFANDERGDMRPSFKVSDGQTKLYSAGGSQHNSTPGKGFNPQQIKKLYGIDQFSGQGAGQTIAIVDAYGNPTMEADLNTFSKQYGLPQTGAFKFTVVNAGGPPDTSSSDANGWMVETTLDVEWAHAVAPQANILLVVAKSASNGDLMKAVDTAVSAGERPSVVSMSFGGPEPKTAKSAQAEDAHYRASGITFIASSGDNGAGVSYPASSPYVLAIGGTSLSASGSETAWTGSGGGVSAVEAVPSYQAALNKAKMRGVPDVSYNADPKTGYAIYFSNPFTISSGKTSGTVSGWFEVGGTSAGSPQWAGLIADVNGERSSPVNAHEALYSLAGSSEYNTLFRDITSGCDGKAASDCAQAGYDTVTGLGSPQANQLLPALVKF